MPFCFVFPSKVALYLVGIQKSVPVQAAKMEECLDKNVKTDMIH